jgi:integrase
VGRPASTSNLIWHGDRATVRKQIPADVRPFVGQREVKISLGQIGRCAAVRQANEISEDFAEMIANARQARRSGNNMLGIFSDFVERYKSTALVASLNSSTGIHTIPMEKPVTFTEILARWSLKRGTDGSFKKFTRFMAQLAEFAVTDNATEITAKHVVEFEASLLKAGKLHVNTISNMLACYKAVFRFAKRNEMIAVNLLADIEVPAKVKSGKKGYSTNQVRMILKTAKELREELYIISLVQAYVGCRISEIANRKRSDIVQTETGIWCLSMPVNETKTDEARIVPLHDAVTAVLLPYMGKVPEGGLLFPKLPRGKTGKAKPSVYAARELQDFIRNKLAITDSDLQPNHSYRRYVQSRLKNAGIDVTDRKRIAGHGEGISDLYQDKDIAALAAAIAKLPTF